MKKKRKLFLLIYFIYFRKKSKEFFKNSVINNTPKYSLKELKRDNKKVHLSSISNFFFSLNFIKKSFSISSFLNEKSNDNAIILIVSGKRIFKDLNIDFNNFYEFLKLLFFDTQKSNFINNQLLENKKLIIFDTDKTSLLWQGESQLFKQNIRIIDKKILTGLILLNVFKILNNYFKNININLKIILELNFQKIEYLKSYFLFSFLDSTYTVLFRNICKFNAIFTTSNSITVEYLRFNLLENSNCLYVTEILHGIGDAYYNTYIQKIKSSYSKHHFIPMINLLNVKLNKDLFDQSIININLNKTIFKSKYFTDNSANKIMYKDLYPLINFDNNCNLIIQVIGSNSHDLDFLTSDIFNLELIYIEIINKLVLKLGCNPIFIYCKHPARQNVDFKNHEIWNDKKTIITSDTMPTLFICDIAFSILSSSIFEAKYLGANVLFPISIIKNLFDNNCINFLLANKSNIENNSYFQIENLLNEMNLSFTNDLIDRANNRLMHYLNSKNNF